MPSGTTPSSRPIARRILAMAIVTGSSLYFFGLAARGQPLATLAHPVTEFLLSGRAATFPPATALPPRELVLSAGGDPALTIASGPGAFPDGAALATAFDVPAGQQDGPLDTPVLVATEAPAAAIAPPPDPPLEASVVAATARPPPVTIRPSAPPQPTPRTTAAPPPPQAVTAAGLSSLEQQLFEGQNSERARVGLAALRVDLGLEAIARRRAQDMATKGYFSHQSPTGETAFILIDAAGISAPYAGENIGYNTYADSASATAVLAAFISSPAHEANIVGVHYSRVGVGVATAANGTKYYSVVFAGP